MSNIIERHPIVDNTDVNFKLVLLVAESDMRAAAKMFSGIVTSRFRLHQKRMRRESFISTALFTVLLGAVFGFAHLPLGGIVWVAVLCISALLVTYYEHSHVRKIYERVMHVLNEVDTLSLDFLDMLGNVSTHVRFDAKIRELEENQKPTLAEMFVEFHKFAVKRYYEKSSQRGR